MRIFYFLICVLLISCQAKKSDPLKKDIGNKQIKHKQLKIDIDVKDKLSLKKNKVILFYKSLFSSDTINMKEFNYFFGDFYIGAERYYREKLGYNKSNFQEFKLCLDDLSSCRSVIFLEILKRKKELLFEYRFETIEKLINESKLVDGAIILNFPNGKQFKFYFNDKSYFESIILDTDIDFMSPFQE
ncbi:hypothetical protein TPENAI_60789 [Tenacibaculum litopenaei]|uniref:hypothetical protein n=1 Tax=Tenacibaculum litopenaei TaxID=396016 RepID=UPI003893096D